MQIEKFIKKFRFHLLYQHVFTHMILIMIITTLVLVAMIQLESIFYFDPEIKKSIIIGILGFFFLITIYWTIYFYQANKNNIKRYKIERLASALGDNIFSDKHDTVLNALQLENGSGQNESKALAQTYIDNVKEKLKSIDMSTWIKINVEEEKFYLSQYTLNSLDNQVFQIKQNGNLNHW